MLCQAKGETAGLCPRKTTSHPTHEELVRSCYSRGSRVELLLRQGRVQGLRTFILSQAASYSSLVPQVGPRGFLRCFSRVCILSLPRLAAVCICPLEPREGHRGWNLLPTDKKRGTEGFRAQEPHGVLFRFRGSKCYYVDWRAAEI